MSINQSIFCGYIGGIFTTPIATPIEVIKCKLQIQKEKSKKNSYYTGVMDLIYKQYKSYYSVLRPIPLRDMRRRNALPACSLETQREEDQI